MRGTFQPTPTEPDEGKLAEMFQPSFRQGMAQKEVKGMRARGFVCKTHNDLFCRLQERSTHVHVAMFVGVCVATYVCVCVCV